MGNQEKKGTQQAAQRKNEEEAAGKNDGPSSAQGQSGALTGNPQMKQKMGANGEAGPRPPSSLDGVSTTDD